MVGDKLNDKQRTIGFSVQTFMIAGGQIAAGVMPLLLFGLGWEISELSIVFFNGLSDYGNEQNTGQ